MTWQETPLPRANKFSFMTLRISGPQLRAQESESRLVCYQSLRLSKVGMKEVKEIICDKAGGVFLK